VVVVVLVVIRAVVAVDVISVLGVGVVVSQWVRPAIMARVSIQHSNNRMSTIENHSLPSVLRFNWLKSFCSKV
jgi:hypothetical protein